MSLLVQTAFNPELLTPFSSPSLGSWGEGDRGLGTEMVDMVKEEGHAVQN